MLSSRVIPNTLKGQKSQILPSIVQQDIKSVKPVLIIKISVLPTTKSNIAAVRWFLTEIQKKNFLDSEYPKVTFWPLISCFQKFGHFEQYSPPLAYDITSNLNRITVK